MDDSCAVCADALEWVAYGPCGHREVCSTCVVRLRFVLGDRNCCICKTENPRVFVTKAMGDYTRVITDFSMLPVNPGEGKAGDFWYHEDTQAYFDDTDHYKMIRATCRLSCSVCDKNAEEQGADSSKRRAKFRSIEQLKGHLFHQHKLFMCNLCLEGRKVFICEQKLYTRSQLHQHIKTGNSQVDGSECERGGFTGHPMCEFCKNPFYGENELYMHMSTEHFTCHICQRQHPGQYDYYQNYSDLEIHFRQEHFLCENEVCLEKKFVVFTTETEMKRHNALEHGGHMSRSKRNSALQIPTSFTFRRSNEQNNLRGRGRGYHPGSSNQLSIAIQASLETAAMNRRDHDPSSSAQIPIENAGTAQFDAVSDSLEAFHINVTSESDIRSIPGGQQSIGPHVLEDISFPPLSDREPPEPSLKYAHALSSSMSTARLGEESFPPLPGAETGSKPKSNQGTGGTGFTLAARLQLRHKGSVKILNSASSSSANPSKKRTSVNSGLVSSTSHSSLSVSQRPPSLNSGSSSQLRLTPSHAVESSSSNPLAAYQSGPPWCGAAHAKPMKENGGKSSTPSSSAWNASGGNRLIRHSSSAPNLMEAQSSNEADQNLPTSENVHTANKSLVEKIRAGLKMDENKFTAFKDISAEYRQGTIDAWEYLSYVEQFGLSHLVLELAYLCPDPQKQEALRDAYNVSLQCQVENHESTPVPSKGKNNKKGKGKSIDKHDISSTKYAVDDSFMSTVRKLQDSQRSQEDDVVEVLSKDQYRFAIGNLPGATSSSSESANSSIASNQHSDGDNGKQRRKTSKFHRVRLGEGSAASLNLSRANAIPEHEVESSNKHRDALPVRGVWRNGGGLKLLSEKKVSK